jgi:hypothetical protein
VLSNVPEVLARERAVIIVHHDASITKVWHIVPKSPACYTYSQAEQDGCTASSSFSSGDAIVQFGGVLPVIEQAYTKGAHILEAYRGNCKILRTYVMIGEEFKIQVTKNIGQELRHHP